VAAVGETQPQEQPITFARKFVGSLWQSAAR
jgi:hypothetical protein